MAINLGSGAIKDMKLGSTSVSKVYLGTNLVWPPASGFGTGTISNGGSIKTINNTYSATQYSTSGSGSGATFTVTLLNRVATSFTVTAEGTGYVVGDTVTLDITGVSAANQTTRVVLTVSTV
tara:strand:- start:67 stop:432 length:366 start_codon:yes stop_codon:yes gene_type:complete